MRQLIGAFAMDVISACAYGIKIDSTNNPDHPIVLSSEKILGTDVNLSMLTSILFPKLAKLLRMNFFNIDSINALDNLINRVKNQRRDNQTNITLDPGMKLITEY